MRFMALRLSGSDNSLASLLCPALTPLVTRDNSPKHQLGVAEKVGNALEQAAGFKNKRRKRNLGEVHAGSHCWSVGLGGD